MLGTKSCVFPSNFVDSTSVRDRGVGGSNPLAPTKFDLLACNQIATNADKEGAPGAPFLFLGTIAPMMTLKRFQVTDFRSVDDSGPIETDNVTAFVGTNEAGKSNILLPLWKFNPAKEGAINPTADYPRKQFSTIRDQKDKPVFCTAVFELDDPLIEKLLALTGAAADELRCVEVTKNFSGQFGVGFPDAKMFRTVARQRVMEVLAAAAADLPNMAALKSEGELKKSLSASVQAAVDSLGDAEDVSVAGVEAVLAALEVKTDSEAKTSVILPRYRLAMDQIKVLLQEVSRVHPEDVDEARAFVVASLPKFVFYSTYGNLDSEIYLPHVIANMNRTDLGGREQAKVRTLKVLFEFVKLKPEEILELGRDFNAASVNRQPTDDEIAAIAEKKKERSILLQSASAQLTRQFREWWKQGEYRFRFEADGDHFRIWVSDDKRPDEIELEGRSTGLQWFLSFYLVFLVERADAHDRAILLLDEPGQSLHPLAQRDLSEFFDGLAKDNQLLYTCHSPFLVDPDRLDRARKVYVDETGSSRVTSDLREGEAAQRGASYAVHAAVGLSVAESLLLGCNPIVVEGPSDQHYLTAMKILLIAAGRLKPGREFVFPPAGGAKGVKAVSSVLGARDGELPVAFFDSDATGRETAKSLRENLYADAPSRVLEVKPFATVADAEIEDLIPAEILIRQLDRWQRAANVPFGDEYKPGTAVVTQIEVWAKKHGVKLAKPGWKVELAKRVKAQMLVDGFEKLGPGVLDGWERVFTAFRVAAAPIDDVAAV
jgi:predicted ATPase